jgi:1,4-alpha-glucan branching enzyme
VRPARAEAKVVKFREAGGTASVTFTLDPPVGAQTAAVCGEWNGWSPTADVMRRDADGGFSVTVELEVGRAYRFRYLLDGVRWENDWAADAYVPNSYGEDDSVVDLTALAMAPPSAAKKAPTKKAPTKKEVAKATKKAATAAELAGKTAKKTKKTKKTK